MVDNYTVKAAGIEKTYLCGSPEVAAKRFLNYLRLHCNERPTNLQIKDAQGRNFEAKAEWYSGRLEGSSFEGAEGEWWRLLKVVKI